MRMNMEIDARHVLPAIGVPTLILHRTGDRLTPVDQARHIAKHIRGATLVELAGEDHTPWVGDTDTLLDEIEEFLTGIRHGPEPDRILATVLFRGGGAGGGLRKAQARAAQHPALRRPWAQ